MLRLIRIIKPFAGYILVATAVFILTMSSIPSIPTLKIKTGDSTIRLDYLIHFCEYGFLAFISFLTFTDMEYRIVFRRSVLVLVCLVLFAYTDEFHQKFIPGRTYNIIDFASNAAGVAGGWLFSVVVAGVVRRK